MRTITVERGYDPREFTLVPFGGMGPTIAGRIAPELGIGRILVPRDPGTFSAYGMLVTDVQQSRSLTRITPLDRDRCRRARRRLPRPGGEALADLMRERFPRERLQTLRAAGMRYRGQSYEVTVPVAALQGPDDLAALARAFTTRIIAATATWRRARRRNRQFPGHRGRAYSQATAADLPDRPRGATGACRDAVSSFRRGRTLSVPVFRRALLRPGAHIEGPAVIEEPTSTTVLYPGQRASIDRYLNIEIGIAAETGKLDLGQCAATAGRRLLRRLGEEGSGTTSACSTAGVIGTRRAASSTRRPPETQHDGARAWRPSWRRGAPGRRWNRRETEFGRRLDFLAMNPLLFRLGSCGSNGRR